MLVRATFTVTAALTALVSGAAVNLHAGNSRFGIAAESVVAAVQAQGVSIQPGQVSFLSAVTATEKAPTLRVGESRKMAGSETAVRLACDSSAVCLPFYVILRDLDQVQETLLSKAVERAQAKPARREKPCMRNGDRASLVIESRDMRITLPVIALQNGRVGEIIRVTDTERKKVYRAEVSGPGLLKSAL